LHKQFNDEQVKMLLRGYCQGVLTRAEVHEMLSIGTAIPVLESDLKSAAVGL
jgi:hypothetical protein